MRTNTVLVLAATIAGGCLLWILMKVHTLQHSPPLGREVLVRYDAQLETAIQVTMGQAADPMLSGVKGVLPMQVMEDIKKFVLFIGSGKSGHSIVGSLMDAHPHVVIPHEYHVFRNWHQFYRPDVQNWTEKLFHLLYQKSIADASGIRSMGSKGYSLKVDNLWQGKFDRYIEVIGDKSGGAICQEYTKDKELFKRRIKILEHGLSFPIRFIHVIRNPFDHIATHSLYAYVGNISAVPDFKRSLIAKDYKFRNDKIVTGMTKKLFALHDASRELIELLGRKNVLDLHISDLVHDPRVTLAKIFEFVEVDASDHYLEVCTGKVFSSMSRSRDLMMWTPAIRKMVEEKMKKYEFLSRYNFTND